LLVCPTIGVSSVLSLWCKKRSLESRRPCVAHVGSPAFLRDGPAIATFYRHLFVSSGSDGWDTGLCSPTSEKQNDDVLMGYSPLDPAAYGHHSESHPPLPPHASPCSLVCVA